YEVRFQRGRFGYLFNKLRHVDVDKKKQWSEALNSVADRIGFCFDGKSDENKFIDSIVEKVKQALSKIQLDESKGNSVFLSKNTSLRLGRENNEIYGLKQRLDELEEKFDLDCQETRYLGVVGMPGIGKTTLARELYETWQCKFVSHVLIQDIRRTSKELGLDCLPALLLKELLGVRNSDVKSSQGAYESYKSELLKHKVLVVLDDVSDRKQIEVLLGRCDWIRQGSRIVISTSDKSLIQDVVDYTYVVPQLNHKDGLGHFGRYAFDHHSSKHNNEVIMKLSKEFVHYEGENVRGIFLNMNEMKREMSLDSSTFEPMHDLRYLKIYSSGCPQQCRPNNKINLPDGLNFPLKEVRYLHWLEFPLKELPPDFNPCNLVDLKLPYSKIERIWSDDKDTSKLKWVDLNHASNLRFLSGLSKARNLQRLNLEGCTKMETLPHDMQHMRSLLFLNLKGCTSLNSLPEISLVSLETLILSNCSNLKEFRVISQNLEALYLDGTSVKKLPLDIIILKRLALLNMKGCTKLKEFPDCLDDLKALKELILSDCSKLQHFPANGESIKVLETLRLDATGLTEIPKISSLQCLCLSKNDQIISLPDNISELYQLKWLDLKYCKSLTSIPKLPPNLQHFDAHGCCSLKTVSNPLACLTTTQQICSTFIFTNCNKLEMSAKKDISSFAQRKCQLLSDAQNSCNVSDLEPLFSTCFPGSELPSWLGHEAVGCMLELRMPPHWRENKLAGLALCAVVSFPNSQVQMKCFSVKCTLKLEVKEGSWIDFSFPVGSWRNQDNVVENTASPEHVFIVYISCSKIFKRLESQHFISSDPTKSTLSSKCSPTKASFKFTVTDGTSEIPGLEVLKCGLRFFIGGESSGECLKKLEVKDAEQNLSAQKLSDNWTSESVTTTEVAVSPENANSAEQSPETATTAVTASPEKANSAEFQMEISTTPREGQPRPCIKTSKWVCFACFDLRKHL
ncbi:hypothetical protein F2Q68_00041399, partial [Brassica cretica]